MCALLGCGGSPSAPTQTTASPPEIHEAVLSGVEVDARQVFQNLGLTYTMLGSMRVAPGVTEDLTLHQLVIDVRDASNRTLFSWSERGYPSHLFAIGIIGGALGSHTDPVAGRPAGTTYVATLTYSRIGGPSRSLQVSGPIISRRPALP